MKEFLINGNDAGQRVEAFVKKVTLSLPTGLLYKSIRLKKIKVNRKRCQVGQLLQEGDTVQCFLSPDFFGTGEERWRTLSGEVTVVYEDANLIVCDKPVGQSSHSDEAQKTSTLIDHIKAYLMKKGEYCPETENSFAPALCNRIDRNTSGLVICAKNAETLREMNRLIRERRLEKTYLAFAEGRFTREGRVTLYLKKEENAAKVKLSPTPREGYLTAVTEFFPLRYEKETDRTLIRVRLITGRTHQIRATAAYLGHPLVGDGKYGRPDPLGLFPYQALRAQQLRLAVEDASPLHYLNGVVITAPEDKKFGKS